MVAKKIKYNRGFMASESKPKSKGRRNDNLIFIICVLIAALFWGLIKMSHIYPASYKFDIQYSNIPVEKRMTSLTDSAVEVNFNARGFLIMKLSLFEDMSFLDIDLSECELMRKEGEDYFIYTLELRDQIASKVELPETEIDFSKTTLGFVLEDLHEKQVEVVSDIKLVFREQYDLYEKEIISPTSVKVFGPKTVLDSINQIFTQNIEFRDVHSDMDISVYINNPLPDLLHFDPDFVSLKIRVEKFTESSIDTPIDFSGIRENIKTFPAMVTVNFKVAQKDFNNIQAGQFRVVPELGGIQLQQVSRLQVSLAEKPDYIRNEWLVPAEVEFLIIK
jgi:hypothetical protein